MTPGGHYTNPLRIFCFDRLRGERYSQIHVMIFNAIAILPHEQQPEPHHLSLSKQKRSLALRGAQGDRRRHHRMFFK